MPKTLGWRRKVSADQVEAYTARRRQIDDQAYATYTTKPRVSRNLRDVTQSKEVLRFTGL
jgi:hypothetical protein